MSHAVCALSIAKACQQASENNRPVITLNDQPTPPTDDGINDPTATGVARCLIEVAVVRRLCLCRSRMPVRWTVRHQRRNYPSARLVNGNELRSDVGPPLGRGGLFDSGFVDRGRPRSGGRLGHGVLGSGLLCGGVLGSSDDRFIDRG